MPRTCTICRHEQRQEIDKALIAGTAFRNIAERFGTSVAALHRHKQEHVPENLVKAREAREVAQADSLLEQGLHEKASKALGRLFMCWDRLSTPRPGECTSYCTL